MLKRNYYMYVIASILGVFIIPNTLTETLKSSEIKAICKQALQKQTYEPKELIEIQEQKTFPNEKRKLLHERVALVEQQLEDILNKPDKGNVLDSFQLRIIKLQRSIPGHQKRRRSFRRKNSSVFDNIKKHINKVNEELAIKLQEEKEQEQELNTSSYIRKHGNTIRKNASGVIDKVKSFFQKSNQEILSQIQEEKRKQAELTNKKIQQKIEKTQKSVARKKSPQQPRQKKQQRYKQTVFNSMQKELNKIARRKLTTLEPTIIAMKKNLNKHARHLHARNILHHDIASVDTNHIHQLRQI